MELTYTKCGDYYIPDLVLPDTSEYHIGKYGRMHKRYLQEQRLGIYTGMVLSGKLWPHLAEIDEACNTRMEAAIAAIAKQEGITEALKASDQMGWVQRMNSIQNRAEEVILSELVYTL